MENDSFPEDMLFENFYLSPEFSGVDDPLPHESVVAYMGGVPEGAQRRALSPDSQTGGEQSLRSESEEATTDGKDNRQSSPEDIRHQNKKLRRHTDVAITTPAAGVQEQADHEALRTEIADLKKALQAATADKPKGTPNFQVIIVDEDAGTPAAVQRTGGPAYVDRGTQTMLSDKPWLLGHHERNRSKAVRQRLADVTARHKALLAEANVKSRERAELERLVNQLDGCGHADRQ